ncbi:MAG: glucosamine-6-phosphate deaminase [Bacteroidetes bacterium]|jgi:glucosamine-6-phosphate deaminase|nr:glucosamine-6-phosphate deaminase [Bacteroidota bacterium]|tara:strand:- start:20006 stop:21898 length:1893 start_codon:yes stop_codon:yes gene_type:complete
MMISYKSPGTLENTRFEKIHSVIFKDSKNASKIVANEIAALIKEKQKTKQNCVLGLATGSSPISVYNELVRMHKEDGLSFLNVISFNLDEYFPMKHENIQSYHHFMNIHLFSHVDIKPENIFIPKGYLNNDEVNNHCQNYDQKIADLGGIDFQLLGIGRTGHIGFNEPGSNYDSLTRRVHLNYITRHDARKSFYGVENVPTTAITMGIKTIRKSKRIVLLAWGQNKSLVIKKAIENEIDSNIPASFLQRHKNVTFVLDNSSSSNLTRIKSPWKVGSCKWNNELKSKAVIWLCKLTKKSVLSLTESDYNENNLSELLLHQTAYEINLEIFNKIQRTITGWPGGKPGVEDKYRPERAEPAKKRVLIFSPHPDDDVISMGGTFDRLVSQGHEVHVAYQTSGNIAVSNSDVLKYIEVFQSFINKKDDELISLLKFNNEILNNKKVRTIASLIREKESLGATRFFGVPDPNVHFLRLPFYETGSIKKSTPTANDKKIMSNIISEIKPHQIYVAGDLADPHGTHKVCLDIFFDVLQDLKNEKFMKDCWVWLYRGAWHEWEIHQIDMSVPMSPNQVLRKRKAIFYHQTQKDNVMFQGDDNREFWVRTEDRNSAIAKRFREIGLSDYAAIETFKRHHF